MIIAFDARAYSWAGVGRYVRDLLGALGQLDQTNQFIVLLGQDDLAAFADLKSTFPADNFTSKLVEDSYYSWREQVIFLRHLVSIKADLFHFPNFNIPLLFKRPYVVTVHDTTRFIFPGQTHSGLLKQIIYEQIFKHSVEKAQAVICVSNATKHELCRLPFRLPKTTATVYEGVDKIFLQPVSEQERKLVRLKIGTRNRYLLYVGVWMNHKNLPRMLSAFAKILPHYPDLKLVLTGRPRPGYVPVNKIAAHLNLDTSQIIYLGHVENKLLPALYAEAAALLYPSLYEGFGLPALEAAACGTPVICSNVSSLPEVVPNAAQFVNPESVQSIVQGIDALLNNKNTRDRLINSAKQIAGNYSWEKCAQETLDIYEQAAKLT